MQATVSILSLMARVAPSAAAFRSTSASTFAISPSPSNTMRRARDLSGYRTRLSSFFPLKSSTERMMTSPNTSVSRFRSSSINDSLTGISSNPTSSSEMGIVVTDTFICRAITPTIIQPDALMNLKDLTSTRHQCLRTKKCKTKRITQVVSYSLMLLFMASSNLLLALVFARRRGLDANRQKHI